MAGNQSNMAMQAFGYMFIVFSFFMLMLGVIMINAENKHEFEYTIAGLSLISGTALLIGGINTLQKSKTKALDTKIRETQLKKQLELSVNMEDQVQGEAHPSKDGEGEIIQNRPEAETVDMSDIEIIAIWEYTAFEWKIMRRAESRRKAKEGIWVSVLVGLLGGWSLKASGMLNLGTALLLAFIIGQVFSLVKVALSNNLFALKSKNKIVISASALLVNEKFKSINDRDIHLKHVKEIIDGKFHFIEFSLEWMTRRGPTNDQFRIYVPNRYLNEIQKVLHFFGAKGIRVEK